MERAAGSPAARPVLVERGGHGFDRIATVLDSFTDEERAEMVEPDGKIHVTCEYCARVYALEAGAGV